MKATADALGATNGDNSMGSMQGSVLMRFEQSDVSLNTAAVHLKLKIQE